MSVAVSGKNKGVMNLDLPDEADTVMIVGIITALNQLDHIGDISVQDRHLVVQTNLTFLKGKDYSDALINLHQEAEEVIIGMQTLVRRA